mmetsp:Transcript_122915/g.392912  ORF Transcript_122915/g.392912 Transcript_122915/m.392912 type:complete len:591 (+) Transcript_122915:71-1843(+)
MGGASSYYSILFIVAFLLAIWGAAKVSKALGVSSIVLEIAVGLVLSPQVLGFLPKEYSVCYEDMSVDCSSRFDQERIANLGTEFCDLQAYFDKGLHDNFWNATSVTLDGHEYHLGTEGHSRRLSGGKAGKTEYSAYSTCLEQGCKLDLAMKCGGAPNILTLIGHTGVAMMIFESGMHFDFEQARTVGLPACAVAILGTLLPLVSGCLLTMAYGFDFQNGFAAGTSLAPTSVGIALRLLHEAKSLQTYFGQAIITAAFVDDILSLILYNILFSLKDTITFMTFLPLILGIVFMMGASALGACWWPKAIAWALARIPDKKKDSKLTMHHELLFILMIGILILYAQITHMCGTHLWGCFIAGMSFAMWKEAHHIWVRQTKRVTGWMIRIFFAATVAFSIPLKDLLSFEALWRGTLMGLGPCILSKVICAPFMGDARWVIGWAMVGRAEFAYLIAQMAAASNMMEPRVFSIVIWALLWATVFAPFIFRYVLARYVRKLKSKDGSADDATTDDPWYKGSSLGSGHLPDLVEEQHERKHVQELEHQHDIELEHAELKTTLQVLEVNDKNMKLKIEALKQEAAKKLDNVDKDLVFAL